MLADIDYHIFRPAGAKASGSVSGCAQCVLDAIGKPRDLLPTTVEDYTRMLLGMKQDEIDRLVTKAQSECFAGAGVSAREKGRAIRHLAKTLTVYLFGHTTPRMTDEAERYLGALDAELAASLTTASASRASCDLSLDKARALQDDMTRGVYDMYAAVSVSLGRRALGAGAASSSDAAAVQHDPFAYRPPARGNIASGGDGASSGDGPSNPFDAMFAAVGTDCAHCLYDVLAKMSGESRSARYAAAARSLQRAGAPIAATIFPVAFIRVFFRHMVEACVADDQRDAALLNMHVYARKLVAIAQLLWAAQLQSAVYR